MDRILAHLMLRIDGSPPGALLLLGNTISLLWDIHHNPESHSVTWGAVESNFQQLAYHGLWEVSPETDELLDSLRVLVGDRSSQDTPLDEKIAIVVPTWPSQNPPPELVSSQDLSAQRVKALNNAYFLHVLVTDPAQILPPGKSLLSVMSRTLPPVDDTKTETMLRKVAEFVHKVFWDEVLDALSNPEPSIQLLRLKHLYKDLYLELSALLPKKHPLLVIFSSPLPPTSSPLDSAVMHLREIVLSLRERCAPIRDSDLETVQQILSNPPARSSPPVDLATFVTESIREIMRFCAIMKRDLSQFVLGNMTEQQLRTVITKQARTAEREIVNDIWSLDTIMHTWTTWLANGPGPTHLSLTPIEPRFSWITCVVQALGSSTPVSCPLPLGTIQVSPEAANENSGEVTDSLLAANINILPPVFFLSTPALLKIQNYLQALVIAASLYTLARVPTVTDSSHPGPNGSDTFMYRVWALLRAEIAEEPGAGDTKLVNLADEVVRARTQASPSSALTGEEEASLRVAVDRTLRPGDPVFKLLQRRLLTELLHMLVKRRQEETSQDKDAHAVPPVLRTGQDGKLPGKQLRLVLDPEDAGEAWSRSPLRVAVNIKGFEDPVLAGAITEVFGRVDNCLGWVESLWNDVIEKHVV